MNFKLKHTGIHFLALIGFVILALAYFSPVLQGKKILQNDIVLYSGMAKQHKDFRAQKQSETYWTNAAFGGMPTYQLGAEYPHDYIRKLDSLLRFLPRPADYLFLYFLGFYVLLLVLKIDYKLAILGAIGFGFSTYLIIIIGVGHNAKAHAIAYMPLVLSGVLITYQRRYFFGFVLTALASGLELVANHFQMTYYLFMLIVILVLWKFYSFYKSKELPHFFKSSTLLLSAAVFAVALNATNFLATSQYASSSTRSQSELTVDANGKPKAPSSGLDKSYITQFSYGKLESLNLFVPRLFGGGNSEKLDDQSNTYEAFKALGATHFQALDQAEQAPMYWGDQPIVEAPAYIGAVLSFLFLLALFLYKGLHQKWLMIGIIFSLLLSYGKNFSLLTDFFINHVPFYNKFRSVSSIQVLLELCVPLMAVLGLKDFFNSNVSLSKKTQALKYASIGLCGLILSLWLFRNTLFDYVGLNDGMYQQYYGIAFVDALRMDREAIQTNDIFRSLFFILLTAGGLWFYLKQNISKQTVIISIGLLLLVDLVAVDRRYVNTDNFVSPLLVDHPFQPTQIDKEIMKDSTVFRVYDLSDNTTRTSYFHNSIMGYSAVKMRRYNELIDFHITKGNTEVLNMLNTKYIIYPDDKNGNQYTQNPEANGNAWFVSGVVNLKSADQEIRSLDSLNTKTTAVTSMPDVQSKDYEIDEHSSIALVNYQPNRLEYQSENSYEGFAVFSENYYNNGWSVTVDGNPVEHYNVNYVLRGISIPKGQHTIVFEFNPEIVKTGASIALLSSILLVLILVGGFIYIFKIQK